MLLPIKVLLQDRLTEVMKENGYPFCYAVRIKGKVHQRHCKSCIAQFQKKVEVISLHDKSYLFKRF